MTTTETRRVEQLTPGDRFTYGTATVHTVVTVNPKGPYVDVYTEDRTLMMMASAPVEVEVPSTDVQVDSLGIIPPRRDWGPGHVRRVQYAHGVSVTYERMPKADDTNGYSVDQRWYYAVWTEDPEGVSAPECEESGYTLTRTEAAEYARTCRDSR